MNGRSGGYVAHSDSHGVKSDAGSSEQPNVGYSVAAHAERSLAAAVLETCG